MYLGDTHMYLWKFDFKALQEHIPKVNLQTYMQDDPSTTTMDKNALF